nr:MAG TPA: hypothetical protein [Caudoviricetes sp.]
MFIYFDDNEMIYLAIKNILFSGRSFGNEIRKEEIHAERRKENSKGCE